MLTQDEKFVADLRRAVVEQTALRTGKTAPRRAGERINKDWGVMKGSIRRGVFATAVCLGSLMVAASPVLAQAERVYTGVTPPTLGGTLLSTGEIDRVLAVQSERATASVVPLQVAGGSVAAAQQAPVGGLAFTGADITGMVLIGVSAVTLGVVLTRRARPRSTP
jgi:hypothetical protein